MNPDAQAQLDTADMMINDPDPAVRRAYLEAYGGTMPTKILYACATDNDGFPTCQGDRTSCGFRGVCSEIDPPPVVAPVTADASNFMMGADQPDDESEEDNDPPWITAKYDGRCSACEEFHIAAGVTRIRADGYDGWEAEECAW